MGPNGEAVGGVLLLARLVLRPEDSSTPALRSTVPQGPRRCSQRSMSCSLACHTNSASTDSSPVDAPICVSSSTAENQNNLRKHNRASLFESGVVDALALLINRAACRPTSLFVATTPQATRPRESYSTPVNASSATAATPTLRRCPLAQINLIVVGASSSHALRMCPPMSAPVLWM